MHNKIKLSIIGFLLISAGLILFFVSDFLTKQLKILPILNSMPNITAFVCIPLILVGIPLAAAGFFKSVGKGAISITLVLMIVFWFLFVFLKGI